MRLQAVSELRSLPVDWLWPGRLALGKLTMLDGDPGLGKSLLALDLCARLSRGLAFPDGRPGPGPCNCVVLNAEDGPGDTLRPRLEALGADLGRVFVAQPDDRSLGPPLLLPAQTERLELALDRTGARLAVLDPVVAYFDPTVRDSNDQSLRRALLPVARLAERYGCAVALVRHLNKKSGARALYRGGGSIGFLGLSRSGWLVGRDPADPARRVLA
jgi:RecA-family ATPase